MKSDSEALFYFGNQQIVNKLNQLPKTQHAASTMKIDVPYTTSNMMMVVISGEVKEYINDISIVHQALCRFNRTFIIIPFGTGCVIINDMFQVTEE